MNGALLIEALSWLLILSGSIFLVIGAFGMVRFPDFWSRLHALSVLDSAGVLLLLAGLCIQGGWSLITAKLIVIAVFLLLTGPTATHALANAALVSGLRPNAETEPSSAGTKPSDAADAGTEG